MMMKNVRRVACPRHIREFKERGERARRRVPMVGRTFTSVKLCGFESRRRHSCRRSSNGRARGSYPRGSGFNSRRRLLPGWLNWLRARLVSENMWVRVPLPALELKKNALFFRYETISSAILKQILIWRQNKDERNS